MFGSYHMCWWVACDSRMVESLPAHFNIDLSGSLLNCTNDVSSNPRTIFINVFSSKSWLSLNPAWLVNHPWETTIRHRWKRTTEARRPTPFLVTLHPILVLCLPWLLLVESVVGRCVGSPLSRPPARYSWPARCYCCLAGWLPSSLAGWPVQEWVLVVHTCMYVVCSRSETHTLTTTCFPLHWLTY